MEAPLPFDVPWPLPAEAPLAAPPLGRLEATAAYEGLSHAAASTSRRRRAWGGDATGKLTRFHDLFKTASIGWFKSFSEACGGFLPHAAAPHRAYAAPASLGSHCVSIVSIRPRLKPSFRACLTLRPGWVQVEKKECGNSKEPKASSAALKGLGQRRSPQPPSRERENCHGLKGHRRVASISTLPGRLKAKQPVQGLPGAVRYDPTSPATPSLL